MEPVPQLYEKFSAMFPNMCKDCHGIGYTVSGTCPTCTESNLCPTCLQASPRPGSICEECIPAYSTLDTVMGRYTSHVEDGPAIDLSLTVRAFIMALNNVRGSHEDKLLINSYIGITAKDATGDGYTTYDIQGDPDRIIVQMFETMEQVHLEMRPRSSEMFENSCESMMFKGLTFAARMFAFAKLSKTGEMISSESIQQCARGVMQDMVKVIDNHAKSQKVHGILLPGNGKFPFNGDIKT